MQKKLKVKVNTNAYSAEQILLVFDYTYMDNTSMLCCLVLAKFKEKMQLIELNGKSLKQFKLTDKEALAFHVLCSRNNLALLNPFVTELFQVIDRQLNTVKTA